MKILCIIILLAFSQWTFADTTKKVVKKKKVDKIEDKIYSVEKTSPEIIIGKREELAEKNNTNYKRPTDLWYVAIIRSSLNYHLPSITANSLSFSPAFLGLTVGKKIEDHFFLYDGFYEISGEWQRFKRESALGSNTLFFQKLDLYQFNVFQNFNVTSLVSRSVFFSVGLGLAPVYFTAEQSVFGNSTSELGYMGMLKGDIAFQLNKAKMKNYEIDIGLKFGWGSVGSHEISTTALSLGLNFE
ncbi:MAG: hypothetical protein H7281_01320 [Bacteriovorax sp.]|nr:hypothetical protein [Bacteriovorax sp.]